MKIILFAVATLVSLLGAAGPVLAAEEVAQRFAIYTGSRGTIPASHDRSVTILLDLLTGQTWMLEEPVTESGAIPAPVWRPLRLIPPDTDAPLPPGVRD